MEPASDTTARLDALMAEMGWIRRLARALVKDAAPAGAAIEVYAVGTPAELALRVALQRVVADEVLALAEPYRSTVLLQFVERLRSGQIARRLGLPAGTVRRHLKVALDQLCERLAARGDGPRHGWLAALVPFARSADPRAPAGAIAGRISVTRLLVVLVVVMVILWIGRVVSSCARI